MSQNISGIRALLDGWTRPATEGRHPWWRRIDPLMCLMGVTALTVYLLHGFQGALSRDVAIYSYAGQQVVEGTPPYLGILNRAGPLAHLIPAIGVAGARIVGIDDLLGMRLLFMIIAVVAVCLVYLLARELFASRLAGLTAAAAFLSFSGFINYATYGPREKTAMVVFLLCALLAATKHRWLTAGICVSLATLVWQPALLVGLAATVTAVMALRRAERIPALVRVVVGGALPAAICIGYFTVVGALTEFIDGFLLINAQYNSTNGLMSNFARRWSSIERGYGVSSWVIVAGLTALAILTMLAMRRASRRDAASIHIAAIGAAAFAGIVWSLRDFQGWPDAFVLLPLAAIGIGGIAKVATEYLSPKPALAVTLAWVVFAVAIAVDHSTSERDRRLVRQRDSVEEMLEQLPPDASILSIEAPQALVLSGTTNPTRHQTFLAGLNRYVHDTWPGGLHGFSAWVAEEQPTVITLGRRNLPSWLRETVTTDYRRMGRVPGWIWYVHRSAIPSAADEPE